MKVYHCYDGTRTKGYWDDVAIKVGGQQVTIWWTHPRYLYEEHIDTIAYEEATAKYEQNTDRWMDGTPQYKKVGKSRKKIVSYLSNMDTPDGFYGYWRDRKKELLETSDFEQTCHFSVRQYDYCRGVSICIPIEVVDESSLHELTMIVRSLLANPEKFKELYGNYKYGKTEWNLENGQPELHVHSIGQ
jgi:hypothetical protein